MAGHADRGEWRAGEGKQVGWAKKVGWAGGRVSRPEAGDHRRGQTGGRA